jgi:VIT1/CCC1 family predicted Fe2+/Mn2+ transporter
MGAMTRSRISRRAARRYHRHLQAERRAAAVYRAAGRRAEGTTREVLLGLADAEERHALHWVRMLDEAGWPPRASERSPQRPSLLTRLALRLGLPVVVPLLERRESVEARRYADEPGAPDHLLAEERLHARIVGSLLPSWRSSMSGSLRAATFGMNDGLVSNVALVMGVAGSGAGDDTILLAGLVGLLGGGLSMGIGEWISVTSQRELWEGEAVLDAEGLEALSDDARADLALLLRARGLAPHDADTSTGSPKDDAEAVARTLAQDEPFDTAALGSPFGAALSNFAAFAVGAAVPVIPFLATSGGAATVAAIAGSAAALFLVGALISLLTHRPMVRAGARQLLIGALAAAITYGAGNLAGSAIG